MACLSKNSFLSLKDKVIINTEEFRQSQADYLFIIRSNQHRKDKGEEKGPVKDDILHYVT